MASEPFNIKKVPEVKNKIEIIYMDKELPPYDILDYADNDDEVLIKDLEKMCRNSFHYQELIKYIRTYMDMNKCSFFENISNIDTTAIQIHLHHTPLTLMEICVIILAKRRFYQECLDIEAIAKEVMYIHYCTLIGLIPVCETVHELIHNKYIFVPNSKVFGKYREFIDLYKPWVPLPVLNKLEHIDQFTTIYDANNNLNAIKLNMIYISLGDNGIGYNLPKMEEMESLLRNHMDSIKSNYTTNDNGVINLVVRTT